jgi:3-deoxy-D-manno-octulosonic-acid transferase
MAAMLLIDLAYLLVLLLTFPFWIRYLFKPGYRRLLGLRLRPRLEPAADPAVWLHAVSVGEVRSLESLVRMLAEEHGQRVVLSVTTPSGFDYAHLHLPQATVIPAPLDFSFTVRRFLLAVRPKLMIFNELELWPNWSHQLHRNRVPTLLVNGRIAASSLRVYRLVSPLLRGFFNGFAAILVQTEIYRLRFLRLGVGPEKMVVCGNVKADEAERARSALPPKAEIRRQLKLGEAERRLIVLASSHEKDEAVVIPVISGLAPGDLFVIVPRHPDRAGRIMRKLRRAGLRGVLFSGLETDSLPAGTRVLVYDRMGSLFPILSIADAVIMGGTFDKRIGGHNLYEPAVLGRPILGGPYTQSFPDISLRLRQGGVYREVRSGAELAAALADLAGIDREALQREAVAAVTERQGALTCIWNRVEPYIRS